MGAVRPPGNQRPVNFDQGVQFHNERVRAERRGDKLGAKTATLRLKRLNQQLEFRKRSFISSLGGTFDPATQKRFDMFRRRNVRRLRNEINPLRQ